MSSSADRLSHLSLRAQRSEPTLQHYCPDGIQFHRDVIRLIRREWNYRRDGLLEILLDGGLGSAKSTLLAHLAITHCLQNVGARCGIVRRSMPDLRGTLWKAIVEHLHDRETADIKPLREGVDYHINLTTGTITFEETGSEIVCISWADRRYKRVRSLNLSMLIIEEGAENDEEDEEGFVEASNRLLRVPGVVENVLIIATNPDDPDHWLYRRYYDERRQHANRFVFTSLTRDNPYLDPNYEPGLRSKMDARQVQRFLEAKWIRLVVDRVYYAYGDENFRPNQSYRIDPKRPIMISWDFNISLGKPLSVALMQESKNAFHVFAEIVVEGMRTEASCDELAARGFLDLPCSRFVVCGDATGKANDTRSNMSDYDIITKFLSNYRRRSDGKQLAFDPKYDLWVPRSNPPIRTRHNLVNGLCQNSLGERRLFVYREAPIADQGMRKVSLVKGGQYLENDKFAYQHISTAIGYACHAHELFANYQPTKVRQL